MSSWGLSGIGTQVTPIVKDKESNVHLHLIARKYPNCKDIPLPGVSPSWLVVVDACHGSHNGAFTRLNVNAWFYCWARPPLAPPVLQVSF